MNPSSEQAGSRDVMRLRKLERVLAWSMSGISVTMTICYFTLVGLHWPALDQSVFGTPMSLGTALGLGCLLIFIGMTVLFTVVSNTLERAERP